VHALAKEGLLTLGQPVVRNGKVVPCWEMNDFVSAEVRFLRSAGLVGGHELEMPVCNAFDCRQVARKKCSRCLVRYCTKECQRTHWKTHKNACGGGET
jgi:hypothetical protein